VSFKLDDSWSAEKALGSSTATGLAEFDIGVPFVQVHEFARHTSDEQFPALVLMIPFRRRSGFYLWRVLLIIVFITVMSWVTFAMDPTDGFANRMNIVVTLFLSIVAFLFAIADNLPKVPYLTFMDKVITLSFIWLFLTAVENFVVYLLHEGVYGTIGSTIDYISLGAFPIGYFAIIIFMYIIMQISGQVAKHRLHARFPVQKHIFRGRQKDIEKLMVSELRAAKKIARKSQ